MQYKIDMIDMNPFKGLGLALGTGMRVLQGGATTDEEG